MVQAIRFELSEEAKYLFRNLRGKNRQQLYKRLDKVMRSEARRYQTGIRKDIDKGLFGVKTRSRNLRKSIEGKAGRFRNVPTFRVGVFRGAEVIKQATTLEHGTKGFNKKSPVDTIRPRKKEYLAIPNPDNPKVVTPSGKKKYSTARKFPGKKRAVIFVKDKRRTRGVLGALYSEKDLARRQRGIRGRVFRRSTLREVKALYFLMKAVDIQPTRFLSKGFEARLPETVERVRQVILDYMDLRK